MIEIPYFHFWLAVIAAEVAKTIHRGWSPCELIQIPPLYRSAHAKSPKINIVP